MVLVFDTYSRRTKMHYISILILITSALIVLITNIFPAFEFSENGVTLMGGICFVGAIQFFIYFCFFKRYIKDGEISFSEDKIATGSFSISLGKVKKLVIVGDRYKGSSKASDGGGNVVVIYDQFDNINRYNFVIKNFFEKKDLQSLITHYSKAGIPDFDKQVR